MSQQPAPSLFVSHHSSKLQTAEHVERALSAKGIKCWIAPRDIEPGASFARAIPLAIKESTAVLLLFCSNSVKSRHVERELILADQLGKAIIPLRLEKIDPGELSYHLAASQWIDWLEQRDASIDRIAARAHEFQNQPALAPSPPVVGASSPSEGDVAAPLSLDKTDQDVAPPLTAFSGSPPPGATPPHLADPSAENRGSRKWLWISLGGITAAALIGLAIWFAVSSNRAPITEEWFAGVWADTRDCEEAYRFDRGGQITGPDGLQGTWSIEGGATLVVVTQGETERRTIERLSDDEVMSSAGRAYRCM